MVSGRRNRRAGHSWERELAETFRGLGYLHVVTTRSESRSRDADKVDLMNKDERVNGVLPFNVQAKCASVSLKYAKLLDQLPKQEGIINVVLHKQTERSGDRFLPRGKFAIMYMEDFLKLIKSYERENARTGVV